MDTGVSLGRLSMFTLEELIQEDWLRFLRKPFMPVKPLSEAAILAYVEEWERSRELENLE